MYEYVLVCTRTCQYKDLGWVHVHVSTYQYVRLRTLKQTCGFLIHPGSVLRVKYNSVQLLCKGYDMMMSNFKKFCSKVQVILVHTGMYWYVLVQTSFTNTFHFNHALSAFWLRRVFTARLTCSSRPASFFKVVSYTVRPPRRALPRPNCHRHRLTSYTLLPRLSYTGLSRCRGSLTPWACWTCQQVQNAGSTSKSCWSSCDPGLGRALISFSRVS